MASRIEIRLPSNMEFLGVRTFAASRRNTWLVRGSIGVDSRDNPFYPARGVYVEGTGRRWLSDDFDSYNEGVVDTRYLVFDLSVATLAIGLSIGVVKARKHG